MNAAQGRPKLAFSNLAKVAWLKPSNFSKLPGLRKSFACACSSEEEHGCGFLHREGSESRGQYVPKARLPITQGLASAIP